MFRPANKLISFTLIAATVFVGLAPATGDCRAKGREGGSERCCGVCCGKLSEVPRTCCSYRVQPQTCQCSVDDERPAAPQEQRHFNEQNEARWAKCVAAILFVGDNEPGKPTIEDADLLSSLPTPRRHAFLCRWQI